MFNPPKGIDRSGVKRGSLEAKMRIMNKSAPGQIQDGFKNADSP